VLPVRPVVAGVLPGFSRLKSMTMVVNLEGIGRLPSFSAKA
jgi:hypothetical protein